MNIDVKIVNNLNMKLILIIGIVVIILCNSSVMVSVQEIEIKNLMSLKNIIKCLINNDTRGALKYVNLLIYVKLYLLNFIPIPVLKIDNKFLLKKLIKQEKKRKSKLSKISKQAQTSKKTSQDDFTRKASSSTIFKLSKTHFKCSISKPINESKKINSKNLFQKTMISKKFKLPDRNFKFNKSLTSKPINESKKINSENLFPKSMVSKKIKLPDRNFKFNKSLTSKPINESKKINSENLFPQTIASKKFKLPDGNFKFNKSLTSKLINESKKLSSKNVSEDSNSSKIFKSKTSQKRSSQSKILDLLKKIKQIKSYKKTNPTNILNSDKNKIRFKSNINLRDIKIHNFNLTMDIDIKNSSIIAMATALGNMAISYLLTFLYENCNIKEPEKCTYVISPLFSNQNVFCLNINFQLSIKIWTILSKVKMYKSKPNVNNTNKIKVKENS